MSPPILALHGNLGTPADWEEVGIPDPLTVALWDHVEKDFFEMAHYLAVDATAGTERPILAGYSLGGRLALHAMAIHPDRWSGAIILSAHPGLTCVEDRTARRASDSVWASRARNGEWADFLASWNAQPVFGSDGEGSFSHRQGGLEVKRGEIALAFETWSLGRQEDLRSLLCRFHAPVLWLSGERDRKFRAIGDSMEAVFPNFQHKTLRGHGHRILSEEAGAVIRGWMEETF